MKIRVAVFITLFLIGCSQLPTNNANDLTGTWNWVSSQGGFVGHTLTPESEGYRQKLIFYGDHSYTITKDGVPQKQGKYKIIMSKYDSSKKLAIQYDSLEAFQSIILELTDTLHLRENCSDCYSHIYVRNE